MRSKTRADHYAESLTDVACDVESYYVIDAARVAFARAIEEERARCLEIVELVCRNVKTAHRALAAVARGKGLPDLSDAHLDRLLDVSALAEEIERQIRGGQ